MLGRKSESGFTLIELMVVVVIIGIISVAIVRGFTKFNANAEEARAQKQMMDLAIQLEKHRAENFTFKGFSIASIALPLDATDGHIRYTLSIVDTDGEGLTKPQSTGYSWAIKATATNGTNNYNLLLNSYGERCKNLSAARVTYRGCGTAIQGAEQW
jgi:type IV pilus assembly protein PilE